MEPFNIVGSSKNNIKLKSYHTKGNQILGLLVKMGTENMVLENHRY